MFPLIRPQTLLADSAQGDGDSEIALVVEDDDLLESTMDGQKYMAARFAATLRRQLYKGKPVALWNDQYLTLMMLEHLGLIEPQLCEGPNERASSFMRPAPHANDDTTNTREDRAVEDPLSDYTQSLLNDTARKNREVFTEIFRPVPTNLIRSWAAYDVSVPTHIQSRLELSAIILELRSEGQDRPCCA